jgi:hypothetical protein
MSISTHVRRRSRQLLHGHRARPFFTISTSPEEANFRENFREHLSMENAPEKCSRLSEISERITLFQKKSRAFGARFVGHNTTRCAGKRFFDELPLQFSVLRFELDVFCNMVDHRLSCVKFVMEVHGCRLCPRHAHTRTPPPRRAAALGRHTGGLWPPNRCILAAFGRQVFAIGPTHHFVSIVSISS